MNCILVNRYKLVKYRECCIQIDTSPGIIVGRVIYGSLYLGDTFWSCIQIDTDWVYWENRGVLDQSVPKWYRLSYCCRPGVLQRLYLDWYQPSILREHESSRAWSVPKWYRLSYCCWPRVLQRLYLDWYQPSILREHESSRSVCT